MKIDADEKELLESVERGEWKPAAGGLPLTALDGIEQLLFVGVNLHGRTPHRGTASWPSGSG